MKYCIYTLKIEPTRVCYFQWGGGEGRDGAEVKDLDFEAI